jgi:hypothetical protein
MQSDRWLNEWTDEYTLLLRIHFETFVYTNTPRTQQIISSVSLDNAFFSWQFEQFTLI